MDQVAQTTSQQIVYTNTQSSSKCQNHPKRIAEHEQIQTWTSLGTRTRIQNWPLSVKQSRTQFAWDKHTLCTWNRNPENQSTKKKSREAQGLKVRTHRKQKQHEWLCVAREVHLCPRSAQVFIASPCFRVSRQATALCSFSFLDSFNSVTVLTIHNRL